jgi:hypothetical protein
VQHAELGNKRRMSHRDDIIIPQNGRTADKNAWRAEVVAALIDADMPDQAEAFRVCQDEASVRFYAVCPVNPDHQTIALSHTCHLRICEDCQRRDQARLMHRYYEPIAVLADRAPRGFRLRHFILTTPISLLEPDVRAQLRRAYDQLARFFDEFWPEDWRERGYGYLAGAEFGVDGLRLHFHILVLCPWMNQNKARKIWTKITGFTALPYIKAVNRSNYTLTDALSEVIKYATKISMLKPELMPVLLAAIARTRRVRCRGAFYNLPQPEKEHKVCPECGARLTLWNTAQFEKWRKGSIGRALFTFDSAALANLLLRLGNKFPGADAAGIGQAEQMAFLWREEPPPRIYTAADCPPKGL